MQVQVQPGIHGKALSQTNQRTDRMLRAESRGCWLWPLALKVPPTTLPGAPGAFSPFPGVSRPRTHSQQHGGRSGLSTAPWLQGPPWGSGESSAPLTGRSRRLWSRQPGGAEGEPLVATVLKPPLQARPHRFLRFPARLGETPRAVQGDTEESSLLQTHCGCWRRPGCRTAERRPVFQTQHTHCPVTRLPREWTVSAGSQAALGTPGTLSLPIHCVSSTRFSFLSVFSTAVSVP